MLAVVLADPAGDLAGDLAGDERSAGLTGKIYRWHLDQYDDNFLAAVVSVCIYRNRQPVCLDL